MPPSPPLGDMSEDAFGRQPTFADHGECVRAILDIGREDVDVAGLQPLDARLTILELRVITCWWMSPPPQGPSGWGMISRSR